MKKSKNIILIVVAVLLFAAAGVGYYFYWEGNTYFQTENAKVKAELYPLNPTVAGKLIKLNIRQGTEVKANEAVARVENGPFIKSPVDGTVVQCDAVINQTVAPTAAIAVVADTSDVYISANIEETDIAKVKVSQPVEVKLDAYPGKTFSAHVESIDNTTQAALTGQTMSMSTSGTYTKVTQLIPVKIILDDSSVQLKDVIGTNATVKIKVR